MSDGFGNSEADLDRGDNEVMRMKEDGNMAPHDNEARWKKADLTFEGRRSGMNMHCSDGDYIGFCVTPDETGFPVHCKVNITQAEAFAKLILAAIK